MTTDERLDRLTERHEALTQSIELLVSAHRDNEQRAEQRDAKLAKLQSALMIGVAAFLQALQADDKSSG